MYLVRQTLGEWYSIHSICQSLFFPEFWAMQYSFFMAIPTISTTVLAIGALQFLL